MCQISALTDRLVLVKGAGDLGTGIAVRLHRCGFAVVMTELPQPMVVRRTVAFAEAVYDGETTVEGIRACRVEDLSSAHRALSVGAVPILIDPAATCRERLEPAVLVDAIMAKRNSGTQIGDAPLVIALGPGFTAPVDCHVVVETNRGHSLGRTIHRGSAEPDTGRPGSVDGKTEERILRAPVAGVIDGCAAIGDRVVEGQLVAMVGGHEVRAAIPGVLRGMIRSGIRVPAGIKIGDVDPRAEPSHCYLVSDKALAIAGGVLEAILSAAAKN